MFGGFGSSPNLFGTSLFQPVGIAGGPVAPQESTPPEAAPQPEEPVPAPTRERKREQPQLATKRLSELDEIRAKGFDCTDKEIQNVLSVHFQFRHDPQQLIELMDFLAQHKQNNLVIATAKHAFSVVKKLDEERKKRDDRRSTIVSVLRQLQKECNTQHHVALRAKTQIEQQMWENLPSYATQNVASLQVQILQIATRAVTAALVMRDRVLDVRKEQGDKVADDIEVNKDVNDTLRLCLQYMEAPEDLVAIIRQLIAKKAYYHAKLFAIGAQKNLLALRAKHKHRAEVWESIHVLQREEEELEKIKKYLSLDASKRFTDLLVDVVDDPPSYDPADPDEYDNSSLMIAKLMIQALVDFPKQFQLPLAPDAPPPPKPTRAEAEWMRSNKKDLTNALDLWLKPENLGNPEHLVELAQLLFNEKHHDHAQRVVQAANKLLDKVCDQQEERKENDAKREELQQARSAQLKKWKTLDDDDEKTYRELEIAHRKDQQILSSFNFLGTDWVTSVGLQAATLEVDVIIARFVFDEDESYTTWSKVIQASLKHVTNPELLCQVAEHIERKHQPHYKLTDLLVDIGQSTQDFVQQYNELRNERLPVQKEFDELQSEEQMLTSQMKHLSMAKQNQFSDVKAKLANLKPLPAFVNVYNSHQYHLMSYRIVSLMTRVILDDKVTLEKKVAKLYEEEDPSKIDVKKVDKERKDVQDRVNNMVKMCLEQFHDPAYLLKFTQDMKQKEETDIVLEVAAVCFSRINEVEGKRRNRQPLQQQLTDAQGELKATPLGKQKQIEDLNAKIAQLEKQLNTLPQWPHYGELDNYSQFDGIRSQIASACVMCTLEILQKHDAAIAAKQFRGESVDTQREKDQRQGLLKKIQSSVDLVCKHLVDPLHFETVIRDILNHQRLHMTDVLPIQTALKIACTFYEKYDTVSQKIAARKAKDVRKQVLTEFEQELGSKKKKPPADLAAELKAINQSQSEQAVEPYLNTNDDRRVTALTFVAGELVSVATLMVSAEVTKITEDAAVSGDEPIIDKQSEVRKALKDAVGQALKGKLPAQSYLDMCKQLTAQKAFEFVEPLISVAKDDVFAVIKHHSVVQIAKEDKNALARAQQALEKVRKFLTVDQMKEMLNLDTRVRVGQSVPSHYNRDSSSVYESLLNTLLEAKLKERDEAAAIEDIEQSEKEKEAVIIQLNKGLATFMRDGCGLKERLVKPQQTTTTSTEGGTSPSAAHPPPPTKEPPKKKAKKAASKRGKGKAAVKEEQNTQQQSAQPVRIDSTAGQQDSEAKPGTMEWYIDPTCQVLTLQHAIDFVRALKEKGEHGLVIEAGSIAESMLDWKCSQLTEWNDMQEELVELERKLAQHVINRDHPRLQQLREKLEGQQPPTSVEEIKSDTLQLTELVIGSAKIENDDEALCQQAIRAFKVDNSAERWEEIKNLTSEDEWSKVKQQLVTFMLQNQKTDPISKIDLLLDDGLWRQCISIFPRPDELEQQEDMKSYMDRLTRVVDIIACNTPEELDSFLPMVTRYVKRYYQEFQFNQVDGLFDVIQRHKAEWIVNLMPTLIDLVLLNILQSQYKDFVKCMRKYKHRLTTQLGRKDLWDKFFLEFQKKHKGKRRLVQMVTLLGDSQVYIPPPTVKQEKKGKKRVKPEPSEKPVHPITAALVDPSVGTKAPKKQKVGALSTTGVGGSSGTSTSGDGSSGTSTAAGGLTRRVSWLDHTTTMPVPEQDEEDACPSEEEEGEEDAVEQALEAVMDEADEEEANEFEDADEPEEVE